jgi:2-C-methyl-D-erythritol 2,4-cyclodiphosphate synthase
VIGGVEIPYERGLDGHSDSDVLAHAVIDALLGAAGLGDIGEHFPDTDERWRDADSIALLEAVVAMVADRGLRIENVDCTVVMEAPKLAPHRPAIRASLARALGLDAARVNVKATTGERMGFVGRGEGVAALAVASLHSAG